MSRPVWSFQLTDKNFVPLGEILNLREANVSLPLNKINSASFKLRLDNPLVEPIVSDLGFVKIFRNNTIIFFGPLISAQEAGEGDNASLQVNASGPEWIFTQRLAGKTAAGVKWAAGVDRALRFKELLETTNADDETHIDYTTGPMLAGSKSSYEATPFKLLSDILNDISDTAEGFDWEIYPVDNWNGASISSNKIGRLQMQEIIGIEQPNAVFEWGAGRNNISKFTRVIDRSTLLNRGYHISSAGPEAAGAPTVTFQDTASIGVYGLQEGLIQADILSQTLRQNLVEENVTVRRNPRQTVSFQPTSDDGTGRVPQFGSDFGLGDFVRARISYGGSVRLDAMTRVWGASFSLDEALTETQTLTLSNDGT